jgi:hypothetical protein
VWRIESSDLIPTTVGRQHRFLRNVFGLRRRAGQCVRESHEHAELSLVERVEQLDTPQLHD